MTALYESGGPASDWDDAPMCECGRGPVYQGDGLGELCIRCWDEVALCDEHGEADCEECAS